jgi:hypothetical protein
LGKSSKVIKGKNMKGGIEGRGKCQRKRRKYRRKRGN